MNIKYDLNKDAVWEASQDLLLGAMLLAKNTKMTALYVLNVIFFWLAVLLALSVYFDDVYPEFYTYSPIFLFILAYATLFLFIKKSVSVCKDMFLKFKHGNAGEHELTVEGGLLTFVTPAGTVSYHVKNIQFLLLTSKHLLIYTAIWGSYIPLDKVSKQDYESVATALEKETGLKIIKQQQN